MTVRRVADTAAICTFVLCVLATPLVSGKHSIAQRLSGRFVRAMVFFFFSKNLLTYFTAQTTLDSYRCPPRTLLLRARFYRFTRRITVRYSDGSKGDNGVITPPSFELCIIIRTSAFCY